MRYVGVFVVALAAAVPGATHGMNWSDTGQSFHFACRILRGDFPYRDFSYQSGFVGLFVHAAALKAFGMQALVCTGVRLVASALGIVALAALVRRLGSPFVATAIGIGTALLMPVTFVELLYAGGNELWAVLFGLAGAAFLVAAANAAEAGRPSSTAPALAGGLCLALVLGARQSEGIVVLLAGLGVMGLLAARRPAVFGLRFAAPATAGIAVGLGLLAAALAAGGALHDGVRELFANAAEKKGIDPVASITQALAGGLLWYGSRTIPLAILPALIGAAAFTAIALPGERIPSRVRTAALVAMPALVLAGVALHPFDSTRTVALTLLNNPTRVFLTLLLARLCLLAPGPGPSGIPRSALLLTCAILLAMVWGHGLSFQGFEDFPQYLLAIPCVAIPCLDRRLPERIRRGAAAAFASVALLIWLPHVATGNLATNDGRMRSATVPLNHPMTRGVRVIPAKAIALDALREKIHPGDSLFIYGSAAPLYTLLDARNPTRLDVTFSDAFTARQAREAVAALQADPPQWIVEAVNLHHAFIARDYDGSPDFYGPHSQEGPRILHEGLTSMRRRYRQVFAVFEVVGYDRMARRERIDWDDVTNLRLWERRD